MQTEIMKLADIIPAEYNPRVELKAGDTEYDALTNSISRFGLVEPLIVNKRNNVLIGGHQRLNVLKEMGVEETEVIVVDLPEEQEKQLNVSLNKIEGEWDMYKLEEVLREIDVDDIIYTGFSEEEVDNIIGINNEEQIDDIVEEFDVEDKEPEEEEQTAPTQKFHIYMSFATFDLMKAFIEEEGLEIEPKEGNHSYTVHMEDE